MLVLYVVALGIGGTLVAASLLLGSNDHDVDADADFDTDFDADVDVDADADLDGDHDFSHADGVGMDAVMAWLPFMSMRFWTFFLAFFGLTGASLTLAEAIGDKILIAIIAGVIGYAAGVTVVSAIRKLRKDEVDSSVAESDYVGSTGVITIAVGKGKTGKVRVEVKGRTVELLAQTEDDATYAIKQSVLIYGVNEDGNVLVTRTDKPEA
jgi:hypothetical protein